MSGTGSVTIFGVGGIHEVQPGDDLASIIVDGATHSGLSLQDRDILVVTHKIVSKSEDRLIDLATIEPSSLANKFGAMTQKDPRQVEVVLRESKRIVRMATFGVLISETEHGLVCANAGVDASNVPGEGMVCLLPLDPDGSAEVLRQALRDKHGVDVAVIISDSFGRPWRHGITNVAIGVAGMDPFADYRGQNDPYGYPLVASRMAIADEIAASAELVMGKLDQVPVAVIRGYDYGPPMPGAATARDLIMESERDLFR